jgi:hypothetical protein
MEEPGAALLVIPSTTAPIAPRRQAGESGAPARPRLKAAAQGNGANRPGAPEEWSIIWPGSLRLAHQAPSH